ncbi:MAG: hypothetical protein AAFY15_04125 [Cyanobacteria bacterium J06648_11]
MLDYHYDDFVRLSEFPIEPEMRGWARTDVSASPTEREIAIVLRESLKAHVKRGSGLADRLCDAIALLLWADANRAAIA